MPRAKRTLSLPGSTPFGSPQVRTTGGSIRGGGLVRNPGGGFRIGPRVQGRSQQGGGQGANPEEERRRQKEDFKQKLLLKLLEQGRFEGDPLTFVNKAVDSFDGGQQVGRQSARERRFARNGERRARNHQFRVEAAKKAAIEREATFRGRLNAKRENVDRLAADQQRLLADTGAANTITTRSTPGSPRITIAGQGMNGNSTDRLLNQNQVVRTGRENQAFSRQIAQRAADTSASALLRNSVPQVVDVATGRPVSPERRNELIKMRSEDLAAAGFKVVAGIDPRSQRVSDEIARGGAQRSAQVANAPAFQEPRVSTTRDVNLSGIKGESIRHFRGQPLIRRPGVDVPPAERRDFNEQTADRIRKGTDFGIRQQDKIARGETLKNPIPPLADALATRARQQEQIARNRQSIRESILRERARLSSERSAAQPTPQQVGTQSARGAGAFRIIPRETPSETQAKLNESVANRVEQGAINTTKESAAKNRFTIAIEEARPGLLSNTLFLSNPGLLGKDSIGVKKLVKVASDTRNDPDTSPALKRAQLLTLASTPGLDQIIERADTIGDVARKARLINPAGASIAAKKSAEYIALVGQLKKLLDPSSIADATGK